MCFTVLISKVYLIRVLSFIGDLRFNVRGEHVQGCIGLVGGREGALLWLPAGGIRASQGTFSSYDSSVVDKNGYTTHKVILICE